MRCHHFCLMKCLFFQLSLLTPCQASASKGERRNSHGSKALCCVSFLLFFFLQRKRVFTVTTHQETTYTFRWTSRQKTTEGMVSKAPHLFGKTASRTEKNIYIYVYVYSWVKHRGKAQEPHANNDQKQQAILVDVLRLWWNESLRWTVHTGQKSTTRVSSATCPLPQKNIPGIYVLSMPNNTTHTKEKKNSSVYHNPDD